MVSKDIDLHIDGKISRTIALSGTHNDRFPNNDGFRIRPQSGSFDVLPFYYYGPKLSGAYTSVLTASSTITHSLLTQLGRVPDASACLPNLLRYLGFDTWIKSGSCRIATQGATT